jgi:hypothetical protein
MFPLNAWDPVLAVALGRVDITTEVSMMSSHLALPRVGHLAQLFHIFAYLKKRHNAEMVFDPSYPVIQADRFPEREMEELYPDTKEEVAPDAPEPLGKEVVSRHWVDADHAGDQQVPVNMLNTGFTYCTYSRLSDKILNPICLPACKQISCTPAPHSLILQAFYCNFSEVSASC